MKHVYLSEEETREQFAKEAAVWFKKHPKNWTYTQGEIESNVWFAMRFGLRDDGVVVFKISDSVEPHNYMELIKTHGGDDGNQ